MIADCNLLSATLGRPAQCCSGRNEQPGLCAVTWCMSAARGAVQCMDWSSPARSSSSSSLLGVVAVCSAVRTQHKPTWDTSAGLPCRTEGSSCCTCSSQSKAPGWVTGLHVGVLLCSSSHNGVCLCQRWNNQHHPQERCSVHLGKENLQLSKPE